MERDTFIFYRDWLNALDDMPEQVQLELYRAICVYALDGSLLDLSPMAKIAFSFIKPKIDRDTDKYVRVVERNRANGKAGGRKPKSTQENPKNPVGYLGTQVNPKNLDNDNVYDNDNVNVNNDDNVDNKKASNVPSGEETSTRVNYKEIVDKYNSILGGKLPKVQSLTEKRKKAIRARISEHGIESIDKVLENVLKSRFLIGYNNRGWAADFDWIFCPSNYVKILEGNYNDRVKSGFNPEVGRILTDNSQKKYEKGW